VFFIQETHSTPIKEHLWRSSWGDNILFSHGESNSSGVAIMFSKCLEYKIIKHKTDTEGRYIISDILLKDKKYTLVNVYMPVSKYENQQIKCLKSLRNELKNFEKDTIIMGGDFNIRMNRKLDQKKTSHKASNDNNLFRNILKKH
jgi:exonuclease III